LLPSASVNRLFGLCRRGQYPRLVPFCIVAGLISLLICLGLLILNIIMFGKEQMGTPVWDRILPEITVAVLLAFPSTIYWDKLLQWLSKAF
jgi:predicted cation transporter